LPFDWTLDDSAVLFISNRTGTSNIFNIFRQRIDQTFAEPLVSGPEQKTISRLSPDGSQILYLVPTSPNDNGGQRQAEIARGGQLVRLMRAPINGGPRQTVIEAPNIVNYQCSRSASAVCVFSTAHPSQLVFSVFDSLSGNPREVAKLGSIENWSLSPDGNSIAAVTFGASDSRIHLISLSGRPTREIAVNGWNSLTSLDWAADGKGFFVSSNPTGRLSTLLHVDLMGNAHALWQVKNFQATWAIPSRSGKYVAMPVSTIGSNVWMVDDF
jgi:Tol biopolymer transport system component